MDTEKCRALLCTIETGSLSAAAEQLGYTPSGISRMMAALELETGFPLLVRSRSGVVPTAECAQMLPVIRELTHWGELYAQHAAALRGLETGVITVGSAYNAYYNWLSQMIVQFSAVYPGIDVRMLQGSSTYLYTALAEHRADFCILSHREGDFDWIQLRHDPLVAWLPKNHPRTREKAFPLKAIETEPYIESFPGQDTDNERFFAQNGITPNMRYTTIDMLATYALVESGLGVSLCQSLSSHGLDTSSIAVLPVEPPQYMDIGIATPRSDDISPAAKRFLEFAKKQLPVL